MITPHDHYRVIFVRARIESIDHTTKHGIGKRDRRKIGLHGQLPLTMFANVLEVAIRTRAFPCGWKIRWGQPRGGSSPLASSDLKPLLSMV